MSKATPGKGGKGGSAGKAKDPIQERKEAQLADEAQVSHLHVLQTAQSAQCACQRHAWVKWFVEVSRSGLYSVMQLLCTDSSHAICCRRQVQLPTSLTLYMFTNMFCMCVSMYCTALMISCTVSLIE